MFICFLFILMCYAFGILFSPFPYWRTYFTLWKTLLFDKEAAIGFQTRIRQGKFLLQYLLSCPLWTLLWHLDNLFYPDHRKMEIKPVFITGQPRSGTTFLHRTLAADTRTFLAIQHIEWRYPFIIFQKILKHSGLARKIAQKNYWPSSDAGQVAAKMHPNKLSDWEEDGIFYEERFLHHFFVFFRFPFPALLRYLDDFPALPEKVQEKILNVHHQTIQKIMFLRGQGKNVHYLSKEVTSHNKFPMMLKRYPEARFIISLRSSAAFMSSLVSLVRFSTMSKTGVDPIVIPAWESTFVQRMKNDSELLIKLCRSIKDANKATIVFKHFNNDIVLAIEKVYDKFDFDLSPAYREHLFTLKKMQKTRIRQYEYEKVNYAGFDVFDQFVRDNEREICSRNGYYAAKQCASLSPTSLQPDQMNHGGSNNERNNPNHRSSKPAAEKTGSDSPKLSSE